LISVERLPVLVARGFAEAATFTFVQLSTNMKAADLDSSAAAC